MIKHVVCFKLKDNSQDAKEKATNVLLSMITKVPQIWGIEVGQNVLDTHRSYDLILQIVVEDLKKLEEFQSAIKNQVWNLWTCNNWFESTVF